ncbi:hypothetical protein AB4Z52_21655 [Rhizobium sp. 2YAF20]|uniref:hypothetical protein n=1 Tax=Rhizobium sp. 2YAF20 TaxID=3233027 RepID=UPI003F9463E2
MTKHETSPEGTPPETDDARSIDGPAADRHRNDLAKAAEKGLHRAMKETDRTSDSHTPTTKERHQHGKK